QVLEDLLHIHLRAQRLLHRRQPLGQLGFRHFHVFAGHTPIPNKLRTTWRIPAPAMPPEFPSSLAAPKPDSALHWLTCPLQIDPPARATAASPPATPATASRPPVRPSLDRS